ncbi:MAG: hypothetical protein R3F11_29195 [Verrucomicrobiales bacterium]
MPIWSWSPRSNRSKVSKPTEYVPADALNGGGSQSDVARLGDLRDAPGDLVPRGVEILEDHFLAAGGSGGGTSRGEREGNAMEHGRHGGGVPASLPQITRRRQLPEAACTLGIAAVPARTASAHR